METAVSPQNPKVHRVVDKMQPPMGSQEHRSKQKQPIKVDNMEEYDFLAEVQISADYKAHQTKILNMHSEFQGMWDGHSGRIRAAKL